jgi:hypothetical protein
VSDVDKQIVEHAKLVTHVNLLLDCSLRWLMLDALGLMLYVHILRDWAL